MDQNTPRKTSGNMKTDKTFTLHLVSDATGTTLQGVARACMAQFEGVQPVHKFWPLIRTIRQLDRVIAKIEADPGPVIFTLVDNQIRQRLQDKCEALHLPFVPVLDPIIRSLSSYLNISAKGIPGLQYIMDDTYFSRMDAIDFAMHHDDGKILDDLDKADVILLGVSRTSKTPTSIFLARRGIKVANIPLIPEIATPEDRLCLSRPLYVGLTASPERLVDLRQTRLKAGVPENQDYKNNAYLDYEQIKDEIQKARRLFTQKNWPVIDVTRRSVEETAAEIMALLQKRRDEQTG